MNPLRSSVTAAAVALALVACGGSEGGSGHGSGTDSSAMDHQASDTTAAGGVAIQAFNDADVLFAQGMIPHHEQAIEMADIALDPTTSAGDAVRALATRIKAAQDPEVEQMTALLTTWGKPLTMDMSAPAMAAMEGMMSPEAMESLDALTGPAFDAAWATMMIEHHRGAISMAEVVTSSGTSPEIRTLAEAIIAAQRAEIAEMEPLAG